jgi:hypothetical protein
MGVDTVTVALLSSTLASQAVRQLFAKIAGNRIANLDSLKTEVPGADEQIAALKDADLVGLGDSGKNLYVTAKGMKVARDLEKIPIG